jgi:hypothetical protein
VLLLHDGGTTVSTDPERKVDEHRACCHAAREFIPSPQAQRFFGVVYVSCASFQLASIVMPRMYFEFQRPPSFSLHLAATPPRRKYPPWLALAWLRSKDEAQSEGFDRRPSFVGPSANVVVGRILAETYESANVRCFTMGLVSEANTVMPRVLASRTPKSAG